MNAFLAKILVTILANVPALAVEIENEFKAIAHGEGGVQKVVTALQNLVTIVETATGLANTTTQPPAQ